MTNFETFFGTNENVYAEKKCIFTASEIASQPRLWKKLAEMLLENKLEIADFLKPMCGTQKVRIILTGAGSSAFVGEALACFAADKGVKCEAIHTTDIISAPHTYLFPDTPTLLVSFGRSGNSPESVGAVEYARKIVKDLYEVAIVCERNSELYNITSQSKKSLALVMPEGSNDKGFAMTSSVTCMLLAGFALFNSAHIDEIVKDIDILAKNVEQGAYELSETAKKYAATGFKRAYYIGSGAFKGLAHESSLKMCELSNGEVCVGFDSAAGFRHGPKAAVNGETLTIHLISNDPFTAKYDADLVDEVCREKLAQTAIAVGAQEYLGAGCSVAIPGGYGFSSGICSGINALVFTQLLAMHKSLALGVTTDDPCPSGQVNRVVKGITIYDLEVC